MTERDETNDRPDAPCPTADAAGVGRAPAAADDLVNPELVKMALRKVKDPELNLNIVDLGLIYDVAVDERSVKVDMTLTSPGCPSGPQIMQDVERVVRGMEGVNDVNVNLVWSPFWSPDRIEPRVRAYLGL